MAVSSPILSFAFFREASLVDVLTTTASLILIITIVSERLNPRRILTTIWRLLRGARGPILGCCILILIVRRLYSWGARFWEETARILQELDVTPILDIAAAYVHYQPSVFASAGYHRPRFVER
jgi:hypothetical protein